MARRSLYRLSAEGVRRTLAKEGHSFQIPHPSATALAHPKITFIKYWGSRDDALCLPANGSISISLGGLAEAGLWSTT